MKSLFGLFRRGKPAAISYEDSKRLVQDKDPSVRVGLAQRDDVRPEILYYLAEDSSPDVRRHIATNESTPAQADRLLARDDDESVRQELAAKLARLAPRLFDEARAETKRFVEETLEILARDQAVRVRQILAEALQDLADAPPAVIRQLARDAHEVVACPVLEFSPLLSDQDLLDLIGEDCASGKLCAISRRRAACRAGGGRHRCHGGSGRRHRPAGQHQRPDPRGNLGLPRRGCARRQDLADAAGRTPQAVVPDHSQAGQFRG